MHAVLRHLRAKGVDEVPAPLVLTEEYEEVSFLPGEAGAACWPSQASDAGLRSAARLLRRVHDATAGWEPPSGGMWAVEPSASGEVVCHGDPGPWNMAWREGRAVGLFDWDFCHPGSRREDVAYALEYVAPFRDDVEAQRWLGFTSPPDRADRLRAFCEEYGISTEGMVDSVVEVQRRTIDRVRRLAAAKVEPQATWVREGFLGELAARVSWSDGHRYLFS